jgi:hypothetical protein
MRQENWDSENGWPSGLKRVHSRARANRIFSYMFRVLSWFTYNIFGLPCFCLATRWSPIRSFEHDRRLCWQILFSRINIIWVKFVSSNVTISCQLSRFGAFIWLTVKIVVYPCSSIFRDITRHHTSTTNLFGVSSASLDRALVDSPKYSTTLMVITYRCFTFIVVRRCVDVLICLCSDMLRTVVLVCWLIAFNLIYWCSCWWVLMTVSKCSSVDCWRVDDWGVVSMFWCHYWGMCWRVDVLMTCVDVLMYWCCDDIVLRYVLTCWWHCVGDWRKRRYFPKKICPFCQQDFAWEIVRSRLEENKIL